MRRGYRPDHVARRLRIFLAVTAEETIKPMLIATTLVFAPSPSDRKPLGVGKQARPESLGSIDQDLSASRACPLQRQSKQQLSFDPMELGLEPPLADCFRAIQFLHGAGMSMRPRL
jgi:hypothetical protein